METVRLITKYALLAFISCGALVLCWEAATFFHPPLLALGLGVVNRKPMCSAWEAYRGVEKHALQARLTDQIGRASHLVQQDGWLARSDRSAGLAVRASLRPDRLPMRCTWAFDSQHPIPEPARADEKTSPLPNRGRER